MARIRTIKPEMAQDEDLAACSIEAQLLAIRILNHCDDEGLFKANTLLVKSNCFPLLDFDSKKILGMIQELSSAGYLMIADGEDGKTYGLVVSFLKHQRVDKPQPSKISDLVEFSEDSTNSLGILPSGKERKGKEGKGKEGKGKGKPPVPPCPHSEIIDLYHKTLPMLPSVMKERWPGSAAEEDLRVRWREHEKHQCPQFWEAFFQVVASNEFWLGENERRWRADLRWLVKRANFDKVMERWENAA